MKTDLGRVRGLLTEAITMLCKSSLVYRTEFCIEGLLGITLDNNEVFLVNIKERVKEMGFTIRSADSTGKEPSSTTVDSHSSSASSKRRRLRRSRSGSKSPTSQVEESMDKPREAVGASSDIKQECVDSTKEGGTSVQQMDFGDMLASYEGSVEDTLGEYDDNEQKPMSSEQSGKSTASKTKNDDGEDDDIVIVKEEKADSAAHAEVMQYASEVEQYDYYEQNQDYQDSEQYDPLSGSVKQDYQSLQQLPGSSYEPWSHETGGSPSKTTPRTATKRSLAGNKSSPRSNTKVQVPCSDLSLQQLTGKPLHDTARSPRGKPHMQHSTGLSFRKVSSIKPVKTTISRAGLTSPEGSRPLPVRRPESLSNEQLLAQGCLYTLACSYCKKSFPSKKALRQHIVGVHGTPQHKCLCGKVFQWRKSYHRHQLKCAGDVYSEDTPQF